MRPSARVDSAEILVQSRAAGLRGLNKAQAGLLVFEEQPCDGAGGAASFQPARSHGRVGRLHRRLHRAGAFVGIGRRPQLDCVLEFIDRAQEALSIDCIGGRFVRAVRGPIRGNGRRRTRSLGRRDRRELSAVEACGLYDGAAALDDQIRRNGEHCDRGKRERQASRNADGEDAAGTRANAQRGAREIRPGNCQPWRHTTGSKKTGLIVASRNEPWTVEWRKCGAVRATPRGALPGPRRRARLRCRSAQGFMPEEGPRVPAKGESSSSISRPSS